MIITSSNVFGYLLERGLITFESVVDGDFMVADTTRRNRNFKIIRRRHQSYFIKQIKTWEPQAIATLQCEATCYWLAQNDSEMAALAALMPKYFFYDTGRHVLITELLPDGEDLGEYHRRLGKFPEEIAQRLGQALGTYHRDAATKFKDGPQTAAFAKQVPWILSVHQQNANLFSPLSGANAQLLNLVQQYPEFQQELDVLRSQWRADSLIHGDIKWDNCLIYPKDGPVDQINLKLVDWELADIGDACWDVGAVFQAYLSSWIASMPMTGETPPAQFIDQAQYPLEEMQPAIRAFWRAYLDVLQVDHPTEKALLERSMKYGAARMIQTAYEWLYYSPQVSAVTLYLLQVSLNILKNTPEAINHLLGL